MPAKNLFGCLQFILLAFIGVYVLSPVDLMPFFAIDDFFVVLFGLGVFGMMFLMDKPPIPPSKE